MVTNWCIHVVISLNTWKKHKIWKNEIENSEVSVTAKNTGARHPKWLEDQYGDLGAEEEDKLEMMGPKYEMEVGPPLLTSV